MDGNLSEAEQAVETKGGRDQGAHRWVLEEACMPHTCYWKPTTKYIIKSICVVAAPVTTYIIPDRNFSGINFYQVGILLSPNVVKLQDATLSGILQHYPFGHLS
jgi:hypothetical protein